MSTWEEGRTYDYYGAALRCVRRYFEGNLELVDLAFVVESPAEPVVFTRTARALAPCVKPVVTNTLGGVLRADACRHDGVFVRVLADAGPNASHECCSGCGGPISSEPRHE